MGERGLGQGDLPIVLVMVSCFPHEVEPPPPITSARAWQGVPGQQMQGYYMPMAGQMPPQMPGQQMQTPQRIASFSLSALFPGAPRMQSFECQIPCPC